MTILTAITSLTLLLVMMVVPSRCVNRPPECYANPPSGSCDGSPSVMYYYDGYPLKQCRNFTYTDCPYVLKNIFETLEECRQICIEGITAPTAAPPPVTPPAPPSPMTPTLGDDLCLYGYDSGTFTFFTPSVTLYYYNSTMNKCVWFKYLGTGGNANSFETVEDCMKRCGRNTTSSVSIPSTITTITTSLSSALPMGVSNGGVAYPEVSFSLELDIDQILMSSVLTYEATDESLPSHISSSQSTSRHIVTFTSAPPTIITTPSTPTEIQPTIDTVQTAIVVYVSLFGCAALVLLIIVVVGLLICVVIKKRRITDVHTVPDNKPSSLTIWHPPTKPSDPPPLPSAPPPLPSSLSSSASSSRGSNDPCLV